jgi:hypothetical protein
MHRTVLPLPHFPSWGVVLIQALGPFPVFALPLVSPHLLCQVSEIRPISIIYSSQFPLSSPATFRQAGCSNTSFERVSLNHAWYLKPSFWVSLHISQIPYKDHEVQTSRLSVGSLVLSDIKLGFVWTNHKLQFDTAVEVTCLEIDFWPWVAMQWRCVCVCVCVCVC